MIGTREASGRSSTLRVDWVSLSKKFHRIYENLISHPCGGQRSGLPEPLGQLRPWPTRTPRLSVRLTSWRSSLLRCRSNAYIISEITVSDATAADSLARKLRTYSTPITIGDRLTLFCTLQAFTTSLLLALWWSKCSVAVIWLHSSILSY